ncbi:RNA_pol_Rpb2_6 domain-containing protein [Nephila pilipes]|uniref:RNA_pol_Rpb2_6 domain-containing protein n=1 Tax=Nephila pilipes TaxID=299642 RepID=A0A8X6U554_NEPPI|nr:RNA_pol_Rpb2_6 domain-containing protein [Nephila pilipes]
MDSFCFTRKARRNESRGHRIMERRLASGALSSRALTCYGSRILAFHQAPRFVIHTFVGQHIEYLFWNKTIWLFVPDTWTNFRRLSTRTRQDAQTVGTQRDKWCPTKPLCQNILLSHCLLELNILRSQECTMDKILPSRQRTFSGGGMRLGNMELFNGLRGNGLAACFEEKFLNMGIGSLTKQMPPLVPKSVQLVQEDARFFRP